jgi:hypothetical protein
VVRGPPLGEQAAASARYLTWNERDSQPVFRRVRGECLLPVGVPGLASLRGATLWKTQSLVRPYCGFTTVRAMSQRVLVTGAWTKVWPLVPLPM